MINHDRLLRSWKSRPMVGKAVAMIVWLSAAMNNAVQTPRMIGRISASVSTQRPGNG